MLMADTTEFGLLNWSFGLKVVVQDELLEIGEKYDDVVVPVDMGD